MFSRGGAYLLFWPRGRGWALIWGELLLERGCYIQGKYDVNFVDSLTVVFLFDQHWHVF